MKLISAKTLIAFSLLFLAVYSCKKDKNADKKLATVTIEGPTDLTLSSATLHGTITEDGNDEITEAGFVYSSNVQQPTTADNKIKSIDMEGDFSAAVNALTSGTKYYVRAYAINSVGTAYSNKIDFTTGNAAPVVSNVLIDGTLEVNKTVTATYTYTDAESDAEGETTFQWYEASSSAGAEETPIDGATENTFVIQDAQNGKFLRVAVTPKATAGTTDGIEIKSAYSIEVGAETVTFTYNGATVTYGTITSSTTQRKWLDRNLGALRLAQSVTDFQAYGDLFQWGRGDDGHQVIDRTDGTDNAIGRNGITSLVEPYETSNDDIPETNRFIINAEFAVRDWRVPQNPNLWQGVNGINNPCPSGWRIPTLAEWNAEGLGSDAFERLKMTYAGRRNFEAGVFMGTSESGLYWTSDVNSNNGRSWYVAIESSGYSSYHNVRATGSSCRCIKN